MLARGLTTTGIGIALGTLSALGLTRYMESLLFETTPYAPGVYLAVAAVLLVAAVAARWLPARRAAQVNPIVALRCE